MWHETLIKRYEHFQSIENSNPLSLGPTTYCMCRTIVVPPALLGWIGPYFRAMKWSSSSSFFNWISNCSSAFFHPHGELPSALSSAVPGEILISTYGTNLSLILEQPILNPRTTHPQPYNIWSPSLKQLVDITGTTEPLTRTNQRRWWRRHQIRVRCGGGGGRSGGDGSVESNRKTTTSPSEQST